MYMYWPRQTGMKDLRIVIAFSYEWNSRATHTSHSRLHVHLYFYTRKPVWTGQESDSVSPHVFGTKTSWHKVRLRSMLNMDIIVNRLSCAFLWSSCRPNVHVGYQIYLVHHSVCCDGYVCMACPAGEAATPVELHYIEHASTASPDPLFSQLGWNERGYCKEKSCVWESIL